MKLRAICILAVVIVALPLIGATAHADAEVGQPAPALVVAELDGTQFDLGALRGKVVVINIWATWCPPCRAEMPQLNAFYQQYHQRGVELIGLSADRRRDLSDVRKVMEAFSYPAAMLSDAAPDGFGEPSELPVTFVIDRSGTVRAVIKPSAQPLTKDSLAAVVTPLLQTNSGG
jgi:cytochrome c biogenesis protein CcmG, thiol:disulfide interchange protein DsbE